VVLSFFVRLVPLDFVPEDCTLVRGEGVVVILPREGAPVRGVLGVEVGFGLSWDVPAREGDLDVVLAFVPRLPADLGLGDCAPLGDCALLGGGDCPFGAGDCALVVRALEGVGDWPARETSEGVDVAGPMGGDVARAIREGRGLAGVVGSGRLSGSGSNSALRASSSVCCSSLRTSRGW
jgi:hypothetical protein